ncbi:MAG TPA: AtpZ/AtpI family protein [Thermodesulfovibrionia bacterium]|nr:AtpZ/AtpI family protein [Thermodesulfovibrionia bacterium]
MRNGSGSGKQFLRGIAVLSTVGINLVVTTFVGFFLGRWLDKVFQTFPWLTITFFILGIVSGFIYLIRMALRNNDRDSD